MLIVESDLGSFAKLYLDARTREGRLLSARDLQERPFDPPTTGPSELRLRNFSYNRVLEYLRGRCQDGGRATGLRVLEIGCGVGWFGARLGRDLAADVYGTDVVFGELARGRLGAARAEARLSLVGATLDCPPFAPGTFDVVVAVAVAQYSSSLTSFVRRCLDLCGARGLLVMADTPFYKNATLGAAQRRSREYYRGLGCASMVGHYYHHSLEELAELGPEPVYWPWRLGNRILRRMGRLASPFPVLAFKNGPQKTSVEGQPG